MTNKNSIYSKTRISNSLNLADLHLKICFICHASFHNSIFILSYRKWLFTKRPSMLHLQSKSDFTARYDIRNWKKTRRQTVKKYKCIKTPCINNWYAKRVIKKYQIGKKIRKDSKRDVIKNHPVFHFYGVFKCFLISYYSITLILILYRFFLDQMQYTLLFIKPSIFQTSHNCA